MSAPARSSTDGVELQRLRGTFLRTGTTGSLGAVVFLFGDALLYWTASGERDFVTIMSEVPLWRLYFGGAVGIVASWLYTFGAWQVYHAVRPAGQTLASTAFGALGALTIGMGAFHVAHAGLGLIRRAAQIAGTDPWTTKTALEQGWGYIATLVWLLTAASVTFLVVFVWAVWSGRSWYPRWCVLWNPGLLGLLYPTVDRLANDNLASLPYLVVSGGFYNLGMLIFFVVSTGALLHQAAPTRLVNAQAR
jgi:hypothetical protein